jgi:hypothetical protein
VFKNIGSPKEKKKSSTLKNQKIKGKDVKNEKDNKRQHNHVYQYNHIHENNRNRHHHSDRGTFNLN